jgi:invasion protein IalB
LPAERRPWLRPSCSAVLGGAAHAQVGGGPPGSEAPKLAMPEVAKMAKDEAPKAPAVKIAGNFGQWALVCGDVKDQAGQEPCSLVQALVEHESQKLALRLTVAYGPRGNLVLRISSFPILGLYFPPILAGF